MTMASVFRRALDVPGPSRILFGLRFLVVSARLGWRGTGESVEGADGSRRQSPNETGRAGRQSQRAHSFRFCKIV